MLRRDDFFAEKKRKKNCYLLGGDSEEFLANFSGKMESLGVDGQDLVKMENCVAEETL